MAGVNEIFTNDTNDEQVMLDAENNVSTEESVPQPETTQETATTTEETTTAQAPVEEKPAEAAPAEDALALTKRLQEQVENLNKALYEQRHKVREFKNYVEQVRNQQAQVKPQAPIVPDFNEAPLEHLKGKTEGAEETLRRIQEEQQAIKSQIETTNVITNIANLENNFRRTVPDYDTAFICL